MNNKLYETIDEIKTKKDFVRFVKLLEEDFTINQEEWENTSIDMFLEAMSAWIEDTERFNKDYNEEVSKSIPWKVFAEILLASKIYE